MTESETQEQQTETGEAETQAAADAAAAKAAQEQAAQDAADAQAAREATQEAAQAAHEAAQAAQEAAQAAQETTEAAQEAGAQVVMEAAAKRPFPDVFEASHEDLLSAYRRDRVAKEGVTTAVQGQAIAKERAAAIIAAAQTEHANAVTEASAANDNLVAKADVHRKLIDEILPITS